MILSGMLFASERHCVSFWLGATRIRHDFHYLPQSIAQYRPELGRHVLLLVLKKVCQIDIAKLRREYRWSFQAKLEHATELVLSVVETLQNTEKQVWVVVDGAYTKQLFHGVKVVLGSGLQQV